MILDHDLMPNEVRIESPNEMFFPKEKENNIPIITKTKETVPTPKLNRLLLIYQTPFI